MLYDLHVHTKFSFDGAKGADGEPASIIEAAAARGIAGLAFCDHFDIDDVMDGIYPPYPEEDVRRAVLEMKETYRGRFDVLYGVELGEPHARPVEAKALCERCGFDFVLGSLHNLVGYPDFYYLKMEELEPGHITYLMDRTVKELLDIVRWGGVSSLAHITYPCRYFDEAGVKVELSRWYDGFEALFREMIVRGAALELNTSGLAKGRAPSPDRDLLALYRDAGGRMVTLGSDAHRARDVGQGLEAGRALLLSLGFTDETVFRAGVPETVPLDR